MRYLFLFSLILFSFNPSVFSAFPQNSLLIQSEQTFQKTHGVQNLKVHEDYSINPFLNSTIVENKVVCTWNNCPCGLSGCETITWYVVDGKAFNSSHPLFKQALVIRKNWSPESDGIDTMIEYRENTYSQPNGIYKPNQAVTVRKYYVVTYKHDTTFPTCGEVKFYNDEALTTSFSYTGWWLNSPKYFTMVCSDVETNCYCAPDDESCDTNVQKVISTPQLLWHKIQPATSFTNKVLLNDTSCEPGGSFPTILFDLRSPIVDMSLWTTNFALNLENNRIYETDSMWKEYDGDSDYPWILRFTREGIIEKKAQSKDISLILEDPYLNLSTHGVSGIKNYTFDIFRIKNQFFQSIPEQKLSACSKTESFVEYNINGNKTLKDQKNIPVSCVELQKSGEYRILVRAYDWAGNETTVTTFLKIYPWDINPTVSTLALSWSTNIFANNKDEYEYTLSLKDSFANPIVDRDVLKVDHSIVWYNLGQNILVKSWNPALVERSAQGLKTDTVGKYRLFLKSLKPGTFTERFRVDYKLWWDDYIQNGSQTGVFITNFQNNIFRKPFSASLGLTQVWALPQLWTEQNYQIILQNIWSMQNFSNGNLAISTSTIKFSSDHYFDTFSVLDKVFSSSEYLTSFDATINTKNSESALLTPSLQSENLNISYNIAWETVVYPLDSFLLWGCNDIDTIGLKVIWNMQGDGKAVLTGQETNFSNVSQASLRMEIEKNAVSLVKWMTSWTTINNIHYHEGDISISGTLPYETLVVKNGNVIIDGNLNTSKKQKLGVIVLRDTGFNAEKDYNTTGNIYVTNNVKEIHAMLFADGTFRSASLDGSSYEDIDLWTKLHLYGSLFSKNTVGWAINAGGKYILPGWGKTTNLQLAKIYDLNYIRRNKACGPDEYSFLIQYNPNVQIDPPKWFFTK